MVTRRTTQRQFWLRPSRTVNQVFRYCLAAAADKSGVQVHCYVVLSNHYHVICTDSATGTLPCFVEELNKLVARCLNCHYGRWENLWAAGTQASYVCLEDDAAIVAKSAYALANPVVAGLVSRGEKWPGERLWASGTYRAKRPKFFFRENGPLPESIDLHLTPPPLVGCGRRDAIKRIEVATCALESATRQDFKKRGKKFLGPAAVRSQTPSHSPRSREPRRNLSAKIATRDKWRRIEVLQRIEGFAEAYKKARDQWLGGNREVLFPAGVYLMRVRYRACCADP